MKHTRQKTFAWLFGMLAILGLVLLFLSEAQAQKQGRKDDIFREITDEDIDRDLQKSKAASDETSKSKTPKASKSRRTEDDETDDVADDESNSRKNSSKSHGKSKASSDDTFREISDEEIESNFQESQKDDGKRSDRDAKVDKKRSKKSASKRSGRRSSKSSARRSKGRNKDKDDDRTPEEREQDRLAHFKKTGVWLWPELTDEQLEKIAEQQALFIQSVQAKCPNTKLQTFESQHFYFVSDCPAAIAKECNQFLEAAYKQLCKMFTLDPDDQIWLGKCAVIAFCKKADYQRYEQNTSSAGRCHMNSNGDVFITCFFDDVTTIDSRWSFIGVLVHEMTHGFVHRYKARGIPPLWLNEGMAEFVSSSVVKADKQVPLKMQQGLQFMKTTQSTGQILSATNDISLPQYGIACGLAKYLVRLKPNGIGLLMDQIKEGTPWEDALKDVYKMTPEQLIAGFGKVNGIPNLQP